MYTWIEIADVNSDGAPDIVAANSADDSILCFLQDPRTPGAFTTVVATDESGSAASIAIADVDGDGDQDIIAGDRAENRVVWWENVDGDGVNFTPHEIFALGGGLGQIMLGVSVVDFDGDGRTDVLSAWSEEDRVRLHSNVGGDPPQFVTHVVTTAPLDAWSVAIGDIDGDGQLDGASTSRDLHTIFWHGNLFYLPADLNGDGTVDAADLAMLLNSWGPDQGFGADLNGDGVVNGADLAQLLANWTP